MFQRRYMNEIDWHTIDEGVAREKLGAYYRSVDHAIADLRAGVVLCTPWAFFRWIPVK